MTMTQENYTNIGYTQGYTTTTTLPSYQFRSTSTFTPIVGERSYISTQSYSPVANKPYRAQTWDENGDPEEDEIAVITEQPLGSPLVLLLMAVLYILYTNRKKIYEKFAQFKKKQ